MSKIKDFFVPAAPPQDTPILELSADDRVDERNDRLQEFIDKLEPPPVQKYTWQHWFFHQLVCFELNPKGFLPMKANDLQVGGTHYKDNKIQPWDCIPAWGLGFLDGNAVKYLARWRHKNGLQDLRKAQHYISKLIEEEEARLHIMGDNVPKHSDPFAEPTLPPPAAETPAIDPSDKETVSDKEITDMAERLTSEPKKPAPVKMKT